MKTDPGQQVLTNVIFHYLEVIGRPAAPSELRTLVDGFGRSFKGRPILELLQTDQRFLRQGEGWGLANWRLFTALDVETTGLSCRDNRVTEIALVRMWGSHIVDRWSSLVNPGCAIPPYITRLTGISDAMVADSPSFPELIDTILSFVGNSTLLAHNAPFDRGFIAAELRRAGCQPLANPWLDTVTLARKYLPQLPNRKLATVAQHLGISTAGHHRAMADALMVAGIFAKMNSLDDSRLAAGSTEA